MTLRYLSIPAADCGWDAPRRALLLLTPPFALLLLLLEASGGEADAALHQRVPGLGVRTWLVLAGAGAVLSVLLMWGTHAKAPPGCHPMLVICGFVVAVMWLDLLAGEVRVPPPHMLEEKPQRTRVRSLPEWVQVSACFGQRPRTHMPKWCAAGVVAMWAQVTPCMCGEHTGSTFIYHSLAYARKAGGRRAPSPLTFPAPGGMPTRWSLVPATPSLLVVHVLRNPPPWL
eukprot:scaffold8383_cov129-Isochrysis_galbana.AAC.2